MKSIIEIAAVSAEYQVCITKTHMVMCISIILRMEHYGLLQIYLL